MESEETRANYEGCSHFVGFGPSVSGHLERTPTAGKQLNILQVNSHEIAGGAETVASNLLKAYEERGHAAWLAVGYRNSDNPRVLDLPVPERSLPWMRPCRLLFRRTAGLEERVRGTWRLRRWLFRLASGWPEVDPESFKQPSAAAVLQLPPFRPDIIHCHNLHSGYFDLRLLPQISGSLPVFLTLHDAWLLSGHCAHSFDCQRWRIGCGHCPDLSIYPSIRYDSSAYNWQRKQAIFGKSSFFVAAPSHWLMDKVCDSILSSAIVEARVVPNGVDLSVFHPDHWRKARAELGLPLDAYILLSVANNTRQNIWKDYGMISNALGRVANSQSGRQTLLIVLGDKAPSEQVGNATVHFVPYTKDARVVARYFQAADVYVHAAKVDTFPSTVLEALACGTPVIATKVGGIPEQVKDGSTGFLVPPGDAVFMATKIKQLLANRELHQRFSEAAAEDVRCRFSLQRQADRFLEWYQEILQNWSPADNRARSGRK